MDTTYQEAIAGTLLATPTGAAVTIALHNHLPIKLQLYQIQQNGTRANFGMINPNSDVSVGEQCVGDYIYVSAVDTGAFIAVITITSGVTDYTIDGFSLCEPNDVGEIPKATSAVRIPQDTPLVMVSCGLVKTNAATNPTGSYIIREQYWSLLGDSYSLAPGEVRQVSYTVVTGKQSTSSAEASISASLGMSASAGWGPTSASLSASLNTSAAVSQQVSVSQESTSYVSDTLSNESGDPQVVYRWQLMDLITIFDVNGNALSGIVTGLAPIIPVLTPINNDEADGVQSFKRASLAQVKVPTLINRS